MAWLTWDRQRDANTNLKTRLALLTQEVDHLRAVKVQKEELEIKTKNLSGSISNIDEQLTAAKRKLQEVQEEKAKRSDPTLQIPFNNKSQQAEQHIQEMHQSMAQLFNFLKQYQIDQPGQTDINFNQLNQEQQNQLKNLVLKVGRICIETIKYENINIYSMVYATRESFSNLFEEGMAPWTKSTPELWIHIVQNIALQQNQIQNLLQYRTQYLQKFGELFEERRKLNSEVIRLMLPQEESEEEGEVTQRKPPPTPLKKVTQRAMYQQQINDVYGRLKNNLRLEQLYYSQLHQALLRSITTLQVAWIMQMCYPEHCDCLAIVNAIHEVFNKPETQQPDI